MSSLADLQELVGFFSYSRDDDADSLGALTALRTRIQGELRGQLGRTAKAFRLWQDKEAIPSGALWETEIKNAVGQAVFFIPIITPTVIASPHCRFELQSFLAREAELGRDDLVFPILYIEVPALEDAARRQNDPVLSLIARRQYVDWSEFRFLDFNSTEVRRSVGRFCGDIRDALNRTWISPQERKQLAEAAAQQQAEAERQRQETETKRRAEEEEARKRNAEEQQRRSAAEAEQRAVEAAEAKRREEEEAQRRRQAEAEKQAEAERQQAETARLRAEAEERLRQVEAEKQAEAAKQAEAERQQAEAARLRAEEEELRRQEARTTGQADNEAPRPPETDTVPKQPPFAAAWLDVQSWSYAKIAVVAAALGLLAWLADQAGLNAIPFAYAYLLQGDTAVYVAGLVFFATKLRGRTSVVRLLAVYLGLYVLEFLNVFLLNLIYDSIQDWPNVERFAFVVLLVVLVLAEWLLISVAFPLPRDTPGARAMPAVAGATGLLRGLVRLTAQAILPTALFYPTIWVIETALMTIMLAYGSGKSAVVHADLKSWSYLKIAIVAAVVGLALGMTRLAPIAGLDMGSVFFLDLQRALYVVALLSFAAAMTFLPSARRFAVIFFGLYLVETMLSLMKSNDTQFVIDALTMLIEWLFIAFCFLSLSPKGALKDWKMLGIALAIGAAQGIAFYPAQPLGFGGNSLLEAFDFATTALCLAYGIRRHPMTAKASPAV